MLYISHRGNLTGPNTAKYGENHPNSILHAIDLGFNCEVDVRWIEGKGYFLGHDHPEYEVDKKFFNNHKLFIHCKDVATFYQLDPRRHLNPYTYIKIFFHQQDDIATIVNSEYLWSFPRADVVLTPRSIAVLPELVPDWNRLETVMGVCSDYLLELQKNILFKAT